MAKEMQRCCLCGTTLCDENAYKAPDKLGDYSPWCLKCQPKVYDHRAALVGFKLAMFLCALEFNMPYIPSLFDEIKKYRKEGVNEWQAYTVVLAKHGHHKGDKMSGFFDGVTDIRKAFSGDMETLQIDDDDDGERSPLSKEARLASWGDGPNSSPYTKADREFLEERYADLTENRAYISKQTDATIRQICEYHLLARRAVYSEDFDTAKKINTMIKELMESEQLRKKDELPQDITRLDDIVLACERAGLHIMDYEELCKELANYAFHKPYPYTRDVADQMILQIRNTTAWNEGVAEVASLPPQFRVTDELGEFATEPDEQEKKMYKELELVRMDGR